MRSRSAAKRAPRPACSPKLTHLARPTRRRFCEGTTRRRQLTHTTTSGGDPIVHCNDPEAENYDSNCNTGSAGNCGDECTFIECADSNDPFNYNPTASNDIGCTR